MTFRTAVLVLLAAPNLAFGATQRFALVIGNNAAGELGLAPLRYADDDAVAVHELLREAGARSILLVNLDEDSRRLHANVASSGSPGPEQVRIAFATLKQEMERARQRGDSVDFYFFFSGHGDVDNGEGYVVLDNGKLTRGQLHRDILSASPATTNHVIVDACKSYFLAFEKGVGGERKDYPAHFAERADASQNTGFVLSTSSGRDSHEWERFQAGIFSHELRSALRGGADADHDGRVTYAELGAFLQTANHAIVNPAYRPDFIVRAPGNDVGDLTHEVLAWLSTPPSIIVDRAVGHVYVENARGERLADVNAARGTTLSLRFSETRPLFVRQSDEKLEYVVQRPTETRLSALRPNSTSVARKGALHLAFESLFAQPFGPGRVEAYAEGYLTGHPDGIEATYDGSVIPALRSAALWTAAGALVAGGGLTLWAHERRNVDSADSQRVRLERNDQMEKLNLAAMVAYGVAGLGAATFGILSLVGPDGSGTVIAPTPTGGTVGVGLVHFMSP
jgi:hypothetical protein